LHNRLWNLELDQKMKTNRHLTTWTGFTNEPRFGREHVDGISGLIIAGADEHRTEGNDGNDEREPSPRRRLNDGARFRDGAPDCGGQRPRGSAEASPSRDYKRPRGSPGASSAIKICASGITIVDRPGFLTLQPDQDLIMPITASATP
jgi:hypothetical protein